MKIAPLIRSLVYSTLFIAFVLVFLPAQVLRLSEAKAPSTMEWPQIVGMVLVVAGAVLAIWCVVTFGTIGQGSPAPFDPPRRLVIRGPYGFVRNPMYVGSLLALGGAALYFTSLPLLGFIIFIWIVEHALVFFYEEPTLRRTFGADYEEYSHHTNRWFPW
jgi:protein-S-isoprenylcysteine O-methyltransferase Ste14